MKNKTGKRDEKGKGKDPKKHSNNSQIDKSQSKKL